MICPPPAPATKASWALFIALAALTACTPPPPTAEGRAAQETLSACRQRADDVFARQNRSSLYAQDDQDSPSSSSYVSGITTRGLSDRFAWDSRVSDCVRNQGAATDTAPSGTAVGAPDAGLPPPVATH